MEPTATPPTIVVADDDDDILALVALRMRRANLSVVTARDGLEALEAVREHSPALAILDVAMPKLSGVEVTKALRAAPETQDVRIILLTARVSAADVAAGLEAGADDYIVKPFSPQDLRSCVESALALR